LTQSKNLEEEAALFRELQREAEVLDQQDARECPVPKPRGVLGRLLGFEEKEGVTVATVKEKS
jgi:cytochrome c oxidase assembly factor 2